MLAEKPAPGREVRREAVARVPVETRHDTDARSGGCRRETVIRLQSKTRRCHAAGYSGLGDVGSVDIDGYLSVSCDNLYVAGVQPLVIYNSQCCIEGDMQQFHIHHLP